MIQASSIHISRAPCAQDAAALAKRVALRKYRYFVGQSYPIDVVADTDGFLASHPDLPGCVVMAADPCALYLALERARRAWILACVEKGEEVPLPNSCPRCCEAARTSKSESCGELSGIDR